MRVQTDGSQIGERLGKHVVDKRPAIEASQQSLHIGAVGQVSVRHADLRSLPCLKDSAKLLGGDRDFGPCSRGQRRSFSAPAMLSSISGCLKNGVMMSTGSGNTTVEL
jgi:hypothetical protein